MYKLIGQNSVKRLADGACIPFAGGNRDYEEYKQWLEEGNIPEPEFTEEELAQKELDRKVAEVKQYLQSTDYKMTVDYFATLEKIVQDDLILKRSEAREFIRGMNNGNSN